jgi:hypothetical protein
VTFIDTSVLCEILQVPGRSQRHAAVMAEFARRAGAGEQFVIPITAVIETGNHIAHAGGHRRQAAQRLVDLIEKVRTSDAPFVLDVPVWDESFLADLCAGDSTGQRFVDLAGSGVMGAGDVAILVQRDRFKQRSNYKDVAIWSLDGHLSAHS